MERSFRYVPLVGDQEADQDTLERLDLSAGLGEPRCPLGGAGGRSGSLWMDEWMDELMDGCMDG